MWRIVCTLLFALALAGIVGQASALAAPDRPDATVNAMAAMPDCVGMTMTADAEDPAAPCDEPGPDCITPPGCAAVAVPLPSSVGFAVRSPAPRRQPAWVNRDDTRAGEQPAPLGNPPKPAQA